MKIVTIVGARPQFIKAAVVSKHIRKYYTEILVHTGQHYDKNMSDIFFDEMEIPKPNYNLGVNNGSHAEMTARMLVELEKVFLNENPDMILVYGDTNSTLAAALVAAKIHIPICHVEAGTRTYCNTNPEEINRVCTDHLSSLLLTCTKKSQENLVKEGLSEKGKLVGDPMYDAFCFYKNKAQEGQYKLKSIENNTALEIPKRFYYLTCHREENTVKEDALKEILTAANQLEFPSIYPVHPRNKKRAMEILKKYKFSKVYLVEPVGYLTSIHLVLNAEKIITDSGGLQREAFFSGKQCVTILDFEVWPETMIQNRNQLCSPNSEDILNKLSKHQVIDENYMPFGDGDSAKKIVAEINAFLK